MTGLPPLQGHFHDLSWDGTFAPEQRPRRYTPVFKPPGAFWTSTLRTDGTTSWTDYLSSVERRTPPGLFVFEVVSAPRLLVLRRDRDLGRAVRDLGLSDGGDLHEAFHDAAFRGEFWERASRAYDAVHVPEDFDRFACFSGYDCESTAWLRPAGHLRLVCIRPTSEPQEEPAPAFRGTRAPFGGH